MRHVILPLLKNAHVATVSAANTSCIPLLCCPVRRHFVTQTSQETATSADADRPSSNDTSSSSATASNEGERKPPLSAAERRRMIDRILRVDHAGELGADRIYAGQLCVLGKRSSVSDLIKHMWDQEKEHLAIMERLLMKHKARVTALAPVWSAAGFVLGAGTALLGKESAMACTVAVEEVIGEHYNDQLRELMADDPEAHKELVQIIAKLRDDEWEHHDTGLDNDALNAPFYSALKLVIQTGCRAAIKVAERV